MRLLLVLLLLFPSVAMATEQCCFKGPGDCFVISSAVEMRTCERTPSTIALNASCKESPECMLSEEPVRRPGELLQVDERFSDITERTKRVRSSGD